MAEQSFPPLLLLALVAFLAPLVSLRIKRMRVPAIILEILLGVALGESGLKLVETTPIIEFLAEFGFIFLMFLSGFELDLSHGPAAAGPRTRIRVGVMLFAATLAGSYLCALGIQAFGLIHDPWLFALILSTTSVGIVLPTLKERGEVGTRFGQCILVASLVADLSTIMLLTVYVVLRTRGSMLQAGLVVLLFGAFFVVWRVGRHLSRQGVVARLLDELAHASTQIKVRGGLVLLVLFVVLAEITGVEAILSAFLAGLLLALLAQDQAGTLAAKLDAIGYGFFIPIFFVMVGVKLDLGALASSGSAVALVGVMIAAAFAVKLLPSLLLVPMFGMRRALAAGFLLSSRLALIIAASNIALELGAIDGTVHAAVVVTAVATCLASPLVYSRLRGEVEIRKPRVVVAGAGRVGRELLRRLNVHGVDTILIERDPEQISKLKVEAGRVIVGDCRHLDVLAQADMGPADVFVALSGTDAHNLEACRKAREVFGLGRAIARDNNPANAELFMAEGVTPLLLSTAVASAVENLVLRPALAQLLDDQEDLFAFEIDVGMSAMVGRRLRELHALGPARAVLLRREGGTGFIDEDQPLEEGDRLVFVGCAEEEHRLRDMAAAGSV